jgi:hypothetical protein
MRIEGRFCEVIGIVFEAQNAAVREREPKGMVKATAEVSADLVPAACFYMELIGAQRVHGSFGCHDLGEHATNVEGTRGGRILDWAWNPHGVWLEQAQGDALS